MANSVLRTGVAITCSRLSHERAPVRSHVIINCSVILCSKINSSESSQTLRLQVTVKVFDERERALRQHPCRLLLGDSAVHEDRANDGEPVGENES